MTTTPEQIEAVARMRLMIQSAVEHDARAWELTDIELAVIAEAAISAMRPIIRAEALEEAAKVAGCAPYNKGGIVCGCSEGLANWIEAEILALKEKP